MRWDIREKKPDSSNCISQFQVIIDQNITDKLIENPRLQPENKLRQSQPLAKRRVKKKEMLWGLVAFDAVVDGEVQIINAVNHRLNSAIVKQA